MEKKKEKNIRFNLARIIFVIIILLLLLLFVKSCGSEAIDTVSRYTKAYKDSLTLELDEKTYYVLHNTNFSLPTAKAYDKAKKAVNIEITIYKNKEKVEEVTTNKIGDKFTVYYKAYKGSMYEKKSIKVEIVRNPTLLDFSVKGISNEWTNKDVEIEIVPNEENIKEYCYNTNCNGVSKKIIKKNETFDVQIKDENGNESKTKTYEVKNIDKEIPKVESVKVIKKDDKKYLVINAVDNLSGINEYSFDDGKTWIKESTLDITKVTATNTYRLKVKDNATNVSVTFSYKYIYEEEETSNPIIDEDKTSPTLTVTTTCENGFKNENWCSGNVSVTINAIDESGIKEYSYDNGNTWSNNSSVIYKKEGNKNLKIKVKDNYDNISETKTTEFNIDKTSPVIEGMPEACTTSVTPNINETNIDKIVFTRNGENSVITSTITEAGLYYINVTDKAGNKAETTFKVETKCIDKTIKILKIINNNYYNVNVEPEVHGTPTIAVLKKDGIYYSFEFGDTLSEEGTYNLYVENKYGNNDEVTFTIDKQKPYVVNELRNTYESDINYQASDKNLNAVVLFKNGVPERCYIDSDSEYQTANVNCETGIIDAVDLKVLYKTYSKTQEDVIRIVAIDKAGNQEEIIIDDKISSVYIPIYSIEDFEAIGSNVNRIINGTSYYMSSNGKYRLMNNLDYNNTKYNTIKASGSISSKITAIDTKKILQKISVDIPYSVVKFLNSESKKTEINFYKYDNQSYGNNYTAYVINAGDNQYKIDNNDVYKYIGNGNDYSNPFSSTSTWGKQNDLVGVESIKILGYSGKTASKNNMLLKNLVIQNATIRSGYVFADNIDTQKKDNGIITGSYKNNSSSDNNDYDFELNYNPETYEVTKFDTILNLKEKIVFEFDENDNEYFTFKNNQYLLNSEAVEVDKSIGEIKITNSEEGTVTEIKYDTSNNDIIEYTSKYEYNMIEQGVELYAKYDSNTEILKLFEGLEITNIDNINNVIQAKKKYDSAIITINYNENNIITSITVDSNEISLDGKSDEEKTIKIVTYNSNNYVLVYLDELIMMTSNDFIEEGMNATYNSVNNSLELINEEMNGIYYFDNNGVAYKTEANGDKYSAYVKYYENNGENCFSLGEEGICESNSKYQYYSFDKEKGIIAYTNNNTVDKYEYDTNTMYIISAKEYKSELSNRFNNYTIGWGVNAQTINFRNPDEILVVSPSENENYILFNFYIENNEPIQIEKTVTFEKGIDYEEARQKNDGSYEIYERKMDELCEMCGIDEYFYKYNNSFYNIDYYREHTYKYLGDGDSFEDLVSNFQTDYPTEYSESDVTDVRVDYYPYRIQDQIIDIYLNDQYKYSTFGNGISNSYGYIHIGKTNNNETSIIYVDNKIYRLDNGTVYLYNESNKTWESTTDELDTDNDNVYVSENFYKYDDTNHVYKKFNFSSRTWNSTLDTVTAEDIGTYAVKYSAVVNDVESVSLSIELDGNNKTIMNLNNSSNNTNNNENSESLFESLDHSYIHDLNISNYNYYGLINNNESLTTGLIVKSIKNSTVENVKISNSNVYHKSNGEYHSLIAGIGGYSENVLYTNNEMDITTISNESYVFDVENYYTTTLTPFAGICFNGYNTSFINNKIIINNSGSEVYGITKEVLYSKELKNNISEINVNNNTISINVVDDQLSEKVCKNKEINQDSSGLSASNNLNNSNVIFGVAYRLSGLDNSNSVPIKMNNNTISLDINGGNTSLLVAGVYLANELTEANNNGISYNVDYITPDCLYTLYEAFKWKCYPWDEYEDHTYNESACTNVYDYRTNAFHDTMSNTSADELKSFYEQRILNYYAGLQMFYDYNMGVNTITDPNNFPTVFGESSTGDLARLFGLFGRNIISKDLDVNNNTISLNQKSFLYGLGRAYPLIGDVITNTNNSINISENKIENFKSEFDYLDFGDDLFNNDYEFIVMSNHGYSGLVSGIFDNDSNPATVNIYDNVVSGQGILKSTLISRNFASESKIYSNTINTEISQGISPLSASLDGEVIGAITEVNYGEIYNNNITITRKASKLLENSLDSGLLLDLQNGTYYTTYYSSRFINVNEITNKDELNKFVSNKYSNGLAFASMNYGNIHDNTIKGNVSLVGINENTGIIGNNTINHSDDIVAYSLPLIVSANKGTVEDLVYNFNSIKNTKGLYEEEGLLVALNMGTINNITLNVANGITSTDDIDNYLISNNYETGIISNFTFNGTITSNSNKNSGIIHTNTGTLTNIVP